MSKRRTCESCEGSGQVAEECIATPVKMPRWDADPVVIKNGWNTPEKCGNCGEPNPALAAAQSVVEDLEHDLLLMMQSRKVLYEGIGQVLMAYGNWFDEDERGPTVGNDEPITLAASFEQVGEAAKSALLAHNRIMDGDEPRSTVPELVREREVLEGALRRIADNCAHIVGHDNGWEGEPLRANLHLVVCPACMAESALADLSASLPSPEPTQPVRD